MTAYETLLYQTYFVKSGHFETMRETQIDSKETIYDDDSGFLEPFLPETCLTKVDGGKHVYDCMQVIPVHVIK